MFKYLICIGLLRHYNSFTPINNKYKGVDHRYPLVDCENNYLIYKYFYTNNILITLQSNKISNNDKLLISQNYLENNKIKPINNIIENTEFDNLIYYF
jgi:hypothetical protein